MKKVFTKYLVFVFLIPVLVLFIFYFFETRIETNTYGVNRKINFGGIDLDEIWEIRFTTYWFLHIQYIFLFTWLFS